MPQENTEVNFRAILEEVGRNDDLFSAAGMRRSRDACDLMFFGRRNAMLEQFERNMLTQE